MRCLPFFTVFLGVLLCSTGASATRNSLSETLNAQGVEPGLQAPLQVVLGGKRDITERLHSIQQSMRPSFQALPKNALGNLAPRSVRHIMRSYFAKEHGWLIRGLEPHGMMRASCKALHEVAILREKTPFLARALLDSRQSERGLSFGDVVAVVAALEQLVLDESVMLLDAAYKLGQQSTEEDITEEELHEILQVYLLFLKHGGTYPAFKDMKDGSVRWEELAIFERDTVLNTLHAIEDRTNPFKPRTFSFQAAAEMVELLFKRYGRWQNYECYQMKDELIGLEKPPGSGRVPISSFYGKKDSPKVAHNFSESVEYLRNTGSIDDSSQHGPKLLISNYVQGPSNCLGRPFRYFSICCLNECDEIMSVLEGKIQAPAASPERLLEVAANLSSTTVEHLRKIPTALVEKMHSIAETNNGEVPLHGRLFAQWLHYLFPNECPYPQIIDSLIRVTQDLFVSKATVEERALHVAPKQSANSGANASEADPERKREKRESILSQWSNEEVLPLHETSSWSPKKSSFSMGTTGWTAAQAAIWLLACRALLIGAPLVWRLGRKLCPKDSGTADDDDETAMDRPRRRGRRRESEAVTRQSRNRTVNATDKRARASSKPQSTANAEVQPAQSILQVNSGQESVVTAPASPVISEPRPQPNKESIRPEMDVPGTDTGAQAVVAVAAAVAEADLQDRADEATSHSLSRELPVAAQGNSPADIQVAQVQVEEDIQVAQVQVEEEVEPETHEKKLSVAKESCQADVPLIADQTGTKGPATADCCRGNKTQERHKNNTTDEHTGSRPASSISKLDSSSKADLLEQEEMQDEEKKEALEEKEPDACEQVNKAPKQEEPVPEVSASIQSSSSERTQVESEQALSAVQPSSAGIAEVSPEVSTEEHKDHHLLAVAESAPLIPLSIPAEPVEAPKEPDPALKAATRIETERSRDSVMDHSKKAGAGKVRTLVKSLESQQGSRRKQKSAACKGDREAAAEKVAQPPPMQFSERWERFHSLSQALMEAPEQASPSTTAVNLLTATSIRENQDSPEEKLMAEESSGDAAAEARELTEATTDAPDLTDTSFEASSEPMVSEVAEVAEVAKVVEVVEVATENEHTTPRIEVAVVDTAPETLTEDVQETLPEALPEDLPVHPLDAHSEVLPDCTPASPAEDSMKAVQETLLEEEPAEEVLEQPIEETQGQEKPSSDIEGASVVGASEPGSCAGSPAAATLESDPTTTVLEEPEESAEPLPIATTETAGASDALTAGKELIEASGAPDAAAGIADAADTTSSSASAAADVKEVVAEETISGEAPEANTLLDEADTPLEMGETAVSEPMQEAAEALPSLPEPLSEAQSSTQVTAEYEDTVPVATAEVIAAEPKIAEHWDDDSAAANSECEAEAIEDVSVTPVPEPDVTSETQAECRDLDEIRGMARDEQDMQGCGTVACELDAQGCGTVASELDAQGESDSSQPGCLEQHVQRGDKPPDVDACEEEEKPPSKRTSLAASWLDAEPSIAEQPATSDETPASVPAISEPELAEPEDEQHGLSGNSVDDNRECAAVVAKKDARGANKPSAARQLFFSTEPPPPAPRLPPRPPVATRVNGVKAPPPAEPPVVFSKRRIPPLRVIPAASPPESSPKPQQHSSSREDTTQSPPPTSAPPSCTPAQAEGTPQKKAEAKGPPVGFVAPARVPNVVVKPASGVKHAEGKAPPPAGTKGSHMLRSSGKAPPEFKAPPPPWSAEAPPPPWSAEAITTPPAKVDKGPALTPEVKSAPPKQPAPKWRDTSQTMGGDAHLAKDEHVQKDAAEPIKEVHHDDPSDAEQLSDDLSELPEMHDQDSQPEALNGWVQESLEWLRDDDGGQAKSTESAVPMPRFLKMGMMPQPASGWLGKEAGSEDDWAFPPRAAVADQVVVEAANDGISAKAQEVSLADAPEANAKAPLLPTEPSPEAMASILHCPEGAEAAPEATMELKAFLGLGLGNEGDDTKASDPPNPEISNNTDGEQQGKKSRTFKGFPTGEGFSFFGSLDPSRGYFQQSGDNQAQLDAAFWANHRNFFGVAGEARQGQRGQFQQRTPGESEPEEEPPGQMFVPGMPEAQGAVHATMLRAVNQKRKGTRTWKKKGDIRSWTTEMEALMAARRFARPVRGDGSGGAEEWAGVWPAAWTGHGEGDAAWNGQPQAQAGWQEFWGAQQRADNSSEWSDMAAAGKAGTWYVQQPAWRGAPEVGPRWNNPQPSEGGGPWPVPETRR